MQGEVQHVCSEKTSQFSRKFQEDTLLVEQAHEWTEEGEWNDWDLNQNWNGGMETDAFAQFNPSSVNVFNVNTYPVW